MAGSLMSAYNVLGACRCQHGLQEARCARVLASGLLQRWIQQERIGAKHEHDRVHEGGSAGVQNDGFIRLEPNLTYGGQQR